MTGNHKLRFVKATLRDCWQGQCARRGRNDRGRDVVRVLELNDQEFRAGKDGETIYLQRMLADKYPNIDLDDYTLKAVQVDAKSRRGGGSVALRLGDVTTEPSNIGGSEDKFSSNDPSTFYRLAFNRPAGADSERVWQLLLKGRLKVRNIVVVMAPTQGRDAAGGGSRNDSSKQNNKKKMTKCTGNNCGKGREVIARASGQRSCYTAGDGRYVDKRDNATVAFRNGCRNGACQEQRERCYESRTCVCADGEGRCKQANSCGAPRGCKFGYATLKMHCPSETFQFN
jgi:hypothetical protein